MPELIALLFGAVGDRSAPKQHYRFVAPFYGQTEAEASAKMNSP
jgi:hypothetical protein